jgi:nucleoside-triphosphatase THEP1
MNNPKSQNPEIYLAGAMYRSREREIGLLQRFADELKTQGWRVGGIVQEFVINTDGSSGGIDAVDLDSGQHIAINRPTKASLETKSCSLDTQALAQTSNAIERAIEHQMDLILVEKYGEQEQQGQGLATDILRAVSEGIPTLVAVPDGVRDRWGKFTGDMGDEIPYTIEAFRAWWEQTRDRS